MPSKKRGGIRGHRPKSSIGDKILAIREGDYKYCFRKGEGKHFLGYGKDTGRKFSFSRFFHKNIEEKTNFPLFFQKSSKCFMFLLHQGGGAVENFLSTLMGGGGSKIALARGTVFWRDSLLESPPSPSPCPPMGGQTCD